MWTTLSSLWLALSGKASAVRTRRLRPALRRPSSRPHVEPLEDRLTPATLTWTGRASPLWSNPANWAQGVTPYMTPEDDDLIFPQDGVTNKVSTHDQAGTVVLNSITFRDDGYTLTGGDIEFFFANMKNLITAGTNTIENRTISVGQGFAASTWLQIETQGSSNLIVTSRIFGRGGVLKSGTGTLTLSGANSYQDTTDFREGTLIVGNGSALGVGRLQFHGGTLQSSTDVTLGNDVEVGTPPLVRAPTIGGSNDITFFGAVEILSNATLTVANTLDGDITFLGVLSGPGGLTKTGAGTLYLSGSGDNIYEGGTDIQDGLLGVGKDNALGQGLLKFSGGGLTNTLINVEFPDITLPNHFEVNGGSIRINFGSYTFTGNGTLLPGKALTVNVNSNGFVTLSGALLGEGGLRKAGVGQLTLSGTAANTYSGITRVNEGILFLSKPAGVNAIAGPLVIGDGVGGERSDEVLLGAPRQIARDAPVTILFTGLLKLNDFNQNLGSVEDNGFIEFGDPPTLEVGFDNRSTTFGGVINGPGELIKVGTGTWTLSGNNTFIGSTVVDGGTLLVDGSLPGPVTVNAGATLGGTGTTGPVTLGPGAAVSPGGAEPGIQRVQDLVFSAESSYVVQLNGLTAGSGHDQLDVTGSVSLNGAALNASLGFSPAPGDTFVIVKNDGADPVAGTFAGLPQGAVVRIGGVAFHIFYDRGDGNDVALVRNVPPAVTMPGDQTAFQNVGLALGGIGVADVDDSNVTVTLQVSHGTLILGSLTGLTVGGNGTSLVSLSGSQAALNAALAGLIYQADQNYSGPDTLTVTADDGLALTTASVAIRVKSLAEQAADLQSRVNALRDAGVLNKGRANSLLVKLNVRDNHGDVGRVHAFLNEVEAFLRAGILSPAQANPLLTAGSILLTGLKRR